MTGSPVEPAAVRDALTRVLGSPKFVQNDAPARLLRFVVEETLNNGGAGLKETVLGIEVFGRGPDFDPKTDSIVRTQAGKLRARLSEYYAGNGSADAVRIDLPKGGYVPVFSATVWKAAAARAEASPARRYWMSALASVAVAALLFSGASWWRARVASSRIRSIAILPFVDMSAHKDQEWFCDGITEEIIDAMTRIPGMHVVARTSAFEFKDKPRDIRKIGEQLGVAAVLEGSVRKDGENLRITAQLNRAADGFHLWSQTFDRRARDIFSTQQEIAVALAARVQIGNAPAHSPHKPSREAYDAYLEGRHFFNLGEAEDMTRSVGRFEAATRLDGEFALAWAWLAIAREYRVDFGVTSSNEGMPGSKAAAERAASLDPDLAESHLALALVKLQYEWDWGGAKRELDRAIALSPESGFILHWRAHWYETQGRLNEALAEMQRALALDPLSNVILGDLEVECLTARRYDEARGYAQRALDLYPDDPSNQAALVMTLFLSGKRDQAKELDRQFRGTSAAKRVPAHQLAIFDAWGGDPRAAKRELAEAAAGVPAYARTQAAAAIHDWDALFHWLDAAYAERSVQLPYARMWPDMPASDARFAALLARMNLPQ